MFFPRTTPLQLAPAQVRGLRLSLNTPVIATEELPIGPARAAILVHQEAGRGETVTIGIRSLRAARVSLFAMDSEVGAETSSDVAFDAALSFAESMGFLFDEEELGDGGAQAKTRCLGLWRDLLGEDAAAAAAAGPAAAEPEELLLDELVEEATEVAVVPPLGVGGAHSDDEESGDFGPVLESEPAPAPALAAAAASQKPVRRAPRTTARDRSDAAAASEAARAAARGGGGRPSLSLSKFRAGPRSDAPGSAPPAAAAKAARPTALGRLRLVRRVRDGVRRRDAILRLLGAF